MTQRFSIRSSLYAAAASLALVACGSPSKPQQSSPSTVSGVASTGSAAATVSLKDSSVPSQVATATAGSGGAFSIDVTGLTPPFMLKAQWSGAAGGGTMFSLAPQAGTANVNPITDALVAAASATGSADDAFTAFGGSGSHLTEDAVVALLNKLGTVLAPLYRLYAVASPITDDALETTSGLTAMLKDVQIVVALGTITVTNRATGGVIYTAPLKDLTSGTFNAANLPAGPGTPPPASTCSSFTYSAWGACQPNNTQARTVMTSSPMGCTGGTPVTSQACVYVPPTPATCTSFTYSTWGACQPDSTQTRTVLMSSPTGCTGGSPVTSQACTYVPPVATCTSFTYSAWGTCQPNNTQTRTVVTSSPSGCTGGSPVTSQACTYVPPACSYTYSAWSACSASGTQSRTVLTTSPTGCAGTPVLTQACTPPVVNPVTAAMVTASCTGCHGLTSNTTVFRSGGYTVVGRSASQWLTTVNGMVGLGASLAPGTTAQNYADYLATAP